MPLSTNSAFLVIKCVIYLWCPVHLCYSIHCHLHLYCSGYLSCHHHRLHCCRHHLHCHHHQLCFHVHLNCHSHHRLLCHDHSHQRDLQWLNCVLHWFWIWIGYHSQCVKHQFLVLVRQKLGRINMLSHFVYAKLRKNQCQSDKTVILHALTAITLLYFLVNCLPQSGHSTILKCDLVPKKQLSLWHY